MDFNRKIDKITDQPQLIINEELMITGGKGEGFLKHDNVIKSTVEIWTGKDKTGNKITNYSLVTKDKYNWRLYLSVYVDGIDRVFLFYESWGDQVEAQDVNELQEGIELMQSDIESHRADTAKHMDGIIDGGSFV